MLITGGTLVTFTSPNQILCDAALLIQGDVIADLGPKEALEAAYPSEPRLSAHGQWVLPGQICAHTHFYGAFARGLALGGDPPGDFRAILERLWWRLDRALRPADIRYSALVGLVDAIRHGTTTLLDHHASPQAIPGSLDILAEAVEESGLRASLCYEVSDRDGPAVAQAGLAENARFIRQAQRLGSHRIVGIMGLHASLTLSDETLLAARRAAQELGVGYHIHVAEGLADVEDALRRGGGRVVQRLDGLGLLGPQTIAAHCVHVSEQEMDLLQGSGTWVVHNPRSNMNNAVGTAPVPAMLAQGIAVGMGNDGFSNAMFQEMQAAYLAHRAATGDPNALGADALWEMATRHNARLAGELFRARLGELAVGAQADIILLDYDPPTPVTPGNWPWHAVFGLPGAHVNTTIASGRVLMRHGELTQLDPAEIAAEARRLAADLWQRL